MSWLCLSKEQTSSQEKNATISGLLKMPATLQFILTVSKFAELLWLSRMWGGSDSYQKAEKHMTERRNHQMFIEEDSTGIAVYDK